VRANLTHRKTNVGAGLLAKAVVQCQMY